MSWKNANKNIMKKKPIVNTVVWLRHALHSLVFSYKNQRLSENEKDPHFVCEGVESVLSGTVYNNNDTKTNIITRLHFTLINIDHVEYIVSRFFLNILKSFKEKKTS